MRRAALLGVVTALACVPAAHAGGGKAKTNLTIDAVFNNPTGTYVSGDISSARKACENKRLVKVYRVKSGKDQKIGQTRSFRGKVDNNYYWTLFKENEFPPSGDYYAKTGATSKCKADRSKNLASDF
jgi:hypothetical protein